MSDRALSLSSAPAREELSWRRLMPAGPLLGLLAALLVLNPIGYIGGGSDDWHYLKAARCWAAEGICLPHDHWSARWPLVAPMAAAIALLGDSRATSGLVPLGYAGAALLLLAHIVQRRFGAPAALAAGAVLLLTPIFSALLLRPSVDTVELAFLLGATAAWLTAIDTGRRRFALLTGLALALAVQTRETSFAYLCVAAVAFLRSSRDHQALLIWAVPGFLAPLVMEAGAYWLASGDLLGRFHLALAHTRIPTTELSPLVDTSRSPLFNPAFIAGWQPSNGIDLHWTINPIVNLLTHYQVGLTLLGALVLSVSLRTCVPTEQRRTLALMVSGAIAATLILIYGLCIDPKPRMFLPLVCGAAAVVGVLGTWAWTAGRRAIPVAVALLLPATALPVLATILNLREAEVHAGRWVREVGIDLTTDETTRRHLALVPELRGVAVDDPSRLYRLGLSWSGCGTIRQAGERTARAYPLRDASGGAATETLCLFRRDGTAAPSNRSPTATVGESPWSSQRHFG